MSLPEPFYNAKEYFEKTVNFLQQHSWIYENSNTNYIKNGTFECMPDVFKSYFKQLDNKMLNRFPHVLDELEPQHFLPDVIKNFRLQLAQLIPEQAFKEHSTSLTTTIDKKLLCGMSVKKQHEIINLTQCIHKLLNDINEQYFVVDFGSGLGYLSRYLNQFNKNYYILGLETDRNRVSAATQRLQKSTTPATSIIANKQIVYKEHFINENTTQAFIENTIKEVFKLNYEPTIIAKWAIIGLHACADLTITSMKLFFVMPYIRYLIIMPCCYHKLKMCAESLKFENFPLSKALQQTLVNRSTAFLNRPFLRLACQQTLKRWSKCTAEQHDSHGYEMFERAIGEAIIDEEEVIVKCKTQGPLIKHQNKTYEDFCERYQLKDKLTRQSLSWRSVHKLRYEALINKYGKEGAQLSEGLVCLQTAMQKLCENFVLYDRLCFMKELAEQLNIKIQVYYEKLLNDELSPRCHALIAYKL